MSEMKGEAAAPPGEPGRLKALADGVFAIVMTILVLELAVPVIKEGAGTAEVAHHVLEMWPEFLFYFLSFFILGNFWLIHHILFDPVKRQDTTLIWLNIIYLMFISLIPFGTSLYGKLGVNTVPAVVYGIIIFFGYLMGFSIWSYSTKRWRLVDDTIPIGIIRGGKIMGYIRFIILGIGIGFAFVSPLVSTIIYAATAAFTITTTMMGKTDTAYTWHVKEKSDGS